MQNRFSCRLIHNFFPLDNQTETLIFSISKLFFLLPQSTFVASANIFLSFFRMYTMFDHFPSHPLTLPNTSHHSCWLLLWSESRSVLSDSWQPMDCSLPGSSLHGIHQAIKLEWVVTSFSRGSSQSRNRALVSCTAGRFFTVWVTRETWVQSLSEEDPLE